MPRTKKVNKPAAVDNTAPAAPTAPVVAPVEPAQPVTGTEVDTSVASKPVFHPEPITDYHEIEVDGVKVRRFNPGGDAERMYQNLTSQPKVPFYIPLGWGEKDPSWQWAQMNDLAIQIEKNKMVMIPKQLADHLMESLKFTADALNPLILTPDGWKRAQDVGKGGTP